MEIIRKFPIVDEIVEAEPRSNEEDGLCNVECVINVTETHTTAAVSVMKTSARKIEFEEPVLQRRASARLQKVPQNKRPFYGSPVKQLDVRKEEKIVKKKVKLTHPQQKSSPKKLLDKGSSSECITRCSSNGVQIGCEESREVSLGEDGEKIVAIGSSADVVDSSVYAKVKEKLKIFNTYYLRFVQEEEMRCKKDIDAPKTSTPKKEGLSGDTDLARTSKRPDLKALSHMLSSNANLFSEKIFGHLPGIDVGRQFFSRTEMVAVGLHGHWLNGIDCLSKGSKKSEKYNGYTFPLAVAIVMSGSYEDDLDNAEDVIYTGQGGNDLLGNRRQVKDQILTRGNLALKNNMDQSVPVRFIRGHKSINSYSGKVYTYDGLYKVVKYWAEKGVSGFTVFKYCLRRIEGQPGLTTDQVLFARGGICKIASELQGLVCADISQGLEDICIPVTNIFDDPPAGPEGFTYTKSIQVTENVKLPSDAPGCKCKGNCTNPNTCACARLNGDDFPYVAKNGGRLIEPQTVVYECGPHCGCGPGCVNRTSQRGPKYRLEVFRTANKGWAVRSWDSIPSGAPVCEYIGVLRRCDAIDNVTENDYIFEIDLLQTIKEIGAREKRLRDVSVPISDHLDNGSENAPEFCLDAGSIGNVARFINHSCEPNLFVQCVFSSHHDVRFARIVLFAAENITPLQELSYDYNYALDSVVGQDGNIKKLPCHCGAACCRKRLY